MTATYTHATDIGPSCAGCDSVHGEGVYQYRRISSAVWEARCCECHTLDRFHTWFANGGGGLGANANVADVRMAHFVVDAAPSETLHYR
jgi:hypothetical protein